MVNSVQERLNEVRSLNALDSTGLVIKYVQCHNLMIHQEQRALSLLVDELLDSQVRRKVLGPRIQSSEKVLNMVGTCFSHAHRTAVAPYAVLRDS